MLDIYIEVLQKRKISYLKEIIILSERGLIGGNICWFIQLVLKIYFEYIDESLNYIKQIRSRKCRNEKLDYLMWIYG